MNEKFLETLFNEACPFTKEGNLHVFYVDTHCLSYKVETKWTVNGWEILAWEVH
jgi:hypothetical protein